MKKESFPICKQNKDSHCNTVGHEYVLANTGRNASIYERNSGVLAHSLDIESKEMSASLVMKFKPGKNGEDHPDKGLLFIGTYVDTLYVFSLKDFKRISMVRTHESILSIVLMKDGETLCLGQADGYVDFVKW